jgi:excinuclease ABC subunit A
VDRVESDLEKRKSDQLKEREPMDRKQIPVSPFNPKRPGTLVGVMTTVSEYLGELYGIIAEARSAGSYVPCTGCGGTVSQGEIDPGRMIAPELSLKNGAVLLWAGTDCAPVPRIRKLAAMIGIDYQRPLEEQDRRFIPILLYGYDKEPVSFVHNKRLRMDYYRGCVFDLQSMIEAGTKSKGNLRMISFFSKKTKCPECHGTGMSKGVGDIHIAGHSLAEADKLPITEMLAFIKSLRQSMDALEFDIVSPIVGHLEPMLLYLSRIGLRSLPPVTVRGGIPAVSS